MSGHSRRSWKNALPVLGLIWAIGAAVDRLWFALDRSTPAWDQAEYLTGALNYWQALQTPQWFSGEWWTNLWLLSSKIPPLVYIVTTPFLSWFGAGPDQSTLINLLFSAILLSSVYALGVYLFTVPVGLWAALLCLLMPGLYRVRLDFLLDYPLASMVTLCFACLTLWRGEARRSATVPEGITWLHKLRSPLLAIAFGVTLGLALMVKQPALLFLLTPIAWVGMETIWQRAWQQFAQLLLAVGVAVLIMGPWYRTNWLLMLTAGKRATIDSAIAEGDPSLLSLNAWTFYLKQLPTLVSLPLLVIPLLGFLLFWRRSRVSSHWLGEADYEPKPREYQQQAYAASLRSLVWLLGFWVGGYVLSSLNINKDVRYVVPYLPVVALILAYGLTLIPNRWRLLQWGTVALSCWLGVANLFPIAHLTTPQPRSKASHLADMAQPYPLAEVVATVVQTEPYLRSTIGVLPSTPELNQHNVNYYGMLRNFQVYGRQVGTRRQQVDQDRRSLSWFITKTGDQGSIRQREAQTAIGQSVQQDPEFQLLQTWQLPDGSALNLHHRRIPVAQVTPILINPPTPSVSEATATLLSPLQLDQVIVPAEAPPGKPMPVTYTWSGSWKSLKTGLVILTWRKQGKAAQATDHWLHDHAIAMGTLESQKHEALANLRFQISERLAMLPPVDLAPGIYQLEATYLDRQTGESFPIAAPAVKVRLNPQAPASRAPELDLVTQLRSLAITLPQGIKALDTIFSEVGRISQYDPIQDYVTQTRQAADYRLQQDPKNSEFVYTLSLANVLKRRVGAAIASLQTAVQLDPKNPYAYAYLAFVNLYDFRPGAAKTAINAALKLNPNLPELHALKGVAALMQGNLVQAWNSVQTYLTQERETG